MAISWILAADSSQAKLYQTGSSKAPLELLEELEHPEARMKNGELYSDEAGRSFDSGGQGRHAMEPGTDAKSVEAQRFAKVLCERLHQAAAEKLFGKLYVVAAPAFLGILRECLDEHVKAKIAGEIPKDVVKETPEAVRKKLPEYL